VWYCEESVIYSNNTSHYNIGNVAVNFLVSGRNFSMKHFYPEEKRKFLENNTNTGVYCEE